MIQKTSIVPYPVLIFKGSFWWLFRSAVDLFICLLIYLLNVLLYPSGNCQNRCQYETCTRCGSHLPSGGQISEEVGGFAELQLGKRAAVNQIFFLTGTDCQRVGGKWYGRRGSASRAARQPSLELYQSRCLHPRAWLDP